jgi:hypothetical protein
MFIGLSAGCLTKQEPVGGGNGATSQLVSFTTNGTYPSGIIPGDFVVYCTHSASAITPPTGFTTISTGTFNTSNNYAYGWRIAATALSGPLLTGFADLIVVLRGPATITGGSAAPDSASWNSLSILTAGSNILALGYSSNTNATIGAGFQTHLSGTGLILATKNTPEPTTGFTYTGFSNTGTAKICYSLGVK